MTHSRRPPPVQFILRLYPGQDDDLIDWLARVGENPAQTKTRSLKEALRKGIGTESLQVTVATPALDLVGVRRVVEAAVASALGRFEGQMKGARSADSAEEDEEVEDLLNAFDASLVLGEEE